MLKKVVGTILIAVILVNMIAGIFFGHTEMALLVILLIRVGLFIAPIFSKEKE